MVNIDKKFILECLRTSFNEETNRNGKECTLPWIESMSMINRNDKITVPTCNSSRSVHHMSSVGHLFSKQLAKYNVTKCPGTIILLLYLDIGG